MFALILICISSLSSWLNVKQPTRMCRHSKILLYCAGAPHQSPARFLSIRLSALIESRKMILVRMRRPRQGSRPYQQNFSCQPFSGSGFWKRSSSIPRGSMIYL
ncbi:hypothetical protein ASPSYDRAFT_912323 [Aspergillus sydowii CBS 593.65]|uniref:Secreted protein n=1 Tax=Aspergillus sydowii CBS 593.65 TaxID=1036612 RepID=A0A1L9TKL3_9EURO|nr:uncharacterized protein ASPSYDRAFT_912323 [Aspergillus sydowii CBS 593.65]OJJ59942.1 hypothetical protein ASPSYDRAFT_912323 [Aspergillus sydowii CBS 593.65]